MSVQFFFILICSGYSYELHWQVDVIQICTNNILLNKEVDKKYSVCNLKTMELLNCELTGVCVVIRSNQCMDKYRGAMLLPLIQEGHFEGWAQDWRKSDGCFSPNLISSPWRRNEDYNISFCKQWKFRCHCSYEQWHLNLHCLQRGPSCP